MKKLNKIIISLALVLILALPVFVSGCTGGDKEGIKIYSNFKTEYYVGETLDLTDGKIEYTDKDGKETVVEITTQMVTAFNTDTVGNRSLIITYQDNTCVVNYTVYKPYEAEIGAVYVNSATAFLVEGNQSYDPNDYYDAIKFKDEDTIDFAPARNNSTQYSDIDWTKAGYTDIQEVSGFTKSFVNGKAVYTFTDAGSNGGTIIISVLNDNEISFSMTSGNETITTTLTKVA